MNRDEIVLQMLKTQKAITAYDFPKGIHYKDAILHLRAKGHDIRMIMIDDPRGINRKIGQYSYFGKKDKPVDVVSDYQQQVFKRLVEAMEVVNLDNIDVAMSLTGYERLLKNVKVTKTTLDFINKEITSYNLRLEQTPSSS